MASVAFTENIQRHVRCPAFEVGGGTVREVLESVFVDNERVRGYILDDQGGLRRHMIIFIDGRAIRDRENLTDPVPDTAEVFVMQALSGG
ncbi:MAG: MoaD/ThiS family protein [Planctomycetota bacterium]|nr:MoaD/ThiS family protein [Planctomycetota bacterium]